MKLGYKFYRVKNKAAIAAIEEFLSEKTKIYKKYRSLAKKIGANPSRSFVRDDIFGFRITGISFDKKPNMDNFLKDTTHGFKPKKTAPFYKEFKELGTAHMDGVLKEVQWKDIHHDGHMYFFNPFYLLNGKYFGFRSPVFDDKKLNYVPVDGVVEITVETYYKYLADKEPRGRKSNVPTPKRGSSGNYQNKRARGGVHDGVSASPKR